MASMLSDGRRFTEDLRGNAIFAFETANRLCGSCVEYHALRPYLRLAGIVEGTDGHAELLRPHFARLTEGRENCRVLIAGAADAGLLAFVANSSAGTPQTVVVDRCPTPLEMCRQFADRWSLPVETRQQALEEIGDVARFDIALCHLTLSFVAPERRVSALGRLRGTLDRNGKLLLVYKGDRKPIDADIAEYENEYLNLALAAVDRLKIALPETRADFESRMRRYARTYYNRRAKPIDFAAAETLLRAAGFRVVHHASLGSRISPLGGAARTAYLAVAEAAG